MSKKVSLLLALTLVFTLVMAVPAMAGYEYEEIDDGLFEVTFYYEGNLDNNSAHVAGDFNDWSATHPDWEMEQVDGRWEITVELEEGIYEYKFTFDGANWTTDRDAEAFAPDDHGGENSVLGLIDTALPGELDLSGNMTNEVTYMGEDEEINVFNEANLRADGIFYQEIEDEDGETERVPLVKYDGTVRLAQDIEDLGSNRIMEEVALDEVSLEDLGVTYMHDWADLSFEANRAGTSSYDYMGLVDSATVHELSDSRRFDITSDKWVDANAALTALTNDITDSELSRTVGTANIRESLLDDTLEVGTSAVVDSGYDAFDEPYRADSLALFAEYEIMDGLTARGQFTHVQANDEIEWAVVFDPEDEENQDILGDLSGDDIEVAVTGDPVADLVDEHGWLPDYEMLERDDDGVFRKTMPTSDGDNYKILVRQKGVDEFDWDGDLHEDGYTDIGQDWEDGEAGGENLEIGNENSEIYFEEQFNRDDFETSQMYLGELSYNIVDESRSLQESIAAGDDITVYQAEFNAGIEAIPAGAFVPFAGDDLNDDDNFDKTEIFADARYDITPEIESTFDFSYQKDFEFDADKELSLEPGVSASLFDDDLEASTSFLFKDEANDENELEAANRRFKADATWTEPIAALDHVTLETEFDPEEEDDFDGDMQEIFAEVQTGVAPFTNHIMANTTQRLNSEVAGYFGEISLDLPVEQIGSLNAEVFFADDDVTFDENAMRYKVDGQIENIPAIGDFLENISAEFEVDEDGIIDAEDYDDDDNDWKKRVGASTFLNLPMLDDFHGLTTEFEMQQLEDDVVADNKEDVDEDRNAQYIVNGQGLEWHAGLTFLTGYDITEDLTANLTLKSDVNHGNIISEYEDDALLIELNKELSEVSTLSASYNRRDEDEGEDYVEVLHELQF